MATLSERLAEAQSAGAQTQGTGPSLTDRLNAATASTQPQQPQAPQPQQMSVQDRAKDVLGLTDYEYRGSILPFGRTKDGKTELALPQVAVDVATSAMLPGHVAQGGSYTPTDVTKFALDYAVPAAAKTKMATGGKVVPTKKQFIANAPSADDLAKSSSNLYKQAGNMGVAVKPTSYDQFLSDLALKMESDGFDSDLHPAAASAFRALAKKKGQGTDIDKLNIAYQQIGDARGATEPGTRRIAGKMQEFLNDYIEKLNPSQLDAGDATGASDLLSKARLAWSRSRKSETVSKILQNAELQASGFENGVRIGFRNLLKNEKKIRGFTPDERALMKEIAVGTGGQKLKRLLAKLSFVKADAGNLVGGGIGSASGAAIGSSIGGPVGAYVGAAVPPMIGYAAQKSAEKSITGQSALLRALAATGGKLPQQPATQSALAKALLVAGGPVAGSQIGSDQGTYR